MKVSVIIPTFNRERFIAQAVESALSQTYDDFEVIVVDDGSTDNTQNVLKAFGNRIRTIIQNNQERASARNHGIRVAAGEAVAFLDSDDFWPKDHLARAMDALNGDPVFDLVWSDVIYVDVNGKEMWRASQKNNRVPLFEALLFKNFINQSSVVVRKRCFLEVGYFNEMRELSGSEDWEMWVRLASRFSFGHLENHFTYYRLHDSWTMTDPQAAQRSMEKALAIMINNPLLAGRIPGGLGRIVAQHQIVMGINYYSVGRMPEARAHFLKALGKDKSLLFSVKVWFYLVRTLLNKNVAEWLRKKKYLIKNKL